MKDLIERQAAIDAVTPFDDEYRIRDAIEDLPSAQPEIIRCRECKYWSATMGYCPMLRIDRKGSAYCSEAERREESE